MTEKRQLARMVIVAVASMMIWTGLGVRLAVLHFGENADLREKVAKIRRVEKEILVGRGRILDRNKNIMSLDMTVKHVFVDPMRIQERGFGRFISMQLGRLLNLDPAMISAKIGLPEREHEYVAKFVHEDKAREIKRLGMHGVHFEDVSARYYPRGNLMSHVLGFSNLEGVGSAGLELRYNKDLKGVPGLRITEVDGKRHEVYDRRGVDIQPQAGSDVILTLDQHLQYYVEKALEKAMLTNNAKGAWAIMQNVKTGEILAMASLPSFDPNSYGSSSQEERRNRAVSYTFEPGSTFKVAVLASVLNEGLVTPETVIDCEGGMWFHAGKPLRDYHPYDKLSVADVLKKSSNIGAAKLALMLGDKRLHEYLGKFGFGRKTEVGIPGEEFGTLHPVDRWSALSITRIAMGHEVAVTAMQMLNMLCAMGNNGFVVKPRMVKQVVSAKGEVEFESQMEVLSRPIRSDTAKLMCKLLTRVVEPGGTARRAAVDGYTVCGKTGTAQKPVNGSYSHDANIASFMGLVPAEDPQIGIIVVVDEPQPLHTGGRVAGPVFREIAEQAVRYLDIPPIPEEYVYRFGDSIPKPAM